MKYFTSKSRMFLLIGSYIGVFGMLAALGYYAMDKTGMVMHAVRVKQDFATDLTYQDLPRMTVTLHGDSSGMHVRLDLSLEVAKKDVRVIDGYQPRMLDRLNGFFGSVDPERLRQTRFMPWLHQEMLKQVNSVGSPAPVRDVVVRQMLIM